KENGAYLIVIDPRETETARLADLHLKVKPGMDSALGNAILKVVVARNYIDEAFIAKRTTGFAELEEHLRSQSLAEMAEMTGVTVKEIRTAAKMFGQAKTGM